MEWLVAGPDAGFCFVALLLSLSTGRDETLNYVRSAVVRQGRGVSEVPGRRTTLPEAGLVRGMHTDGDDVCWWLAGGGCVFLYELRRPRASWVSTSERLGSQW